ncbi:MAG: prepilin-type N-terminal cleavage/methylation domain-containing protein [Kiritimatiellae bacterium]|nr:prepilin-type N-terminal cleavage/methylation domain-containing protein [Kiritimatiellia bacterium]
MRKAFTLLEVLLASVILGLGLMAIIASMIQAQNMMISSTYLQTAQEVMDFGDMAYPLSDVKDPDKDLDVRETKATELWEKFAGDVRLTSEQYEKYREYTWEREALNRKDEDEVKRLGNLYTVRITVRWGDRRRGNGEEESYVTFWRKPE